MSLKHISSFIFAASIATACAPSESSKQQLLDQGCTINTPDTRACDPADTHKTTVCHIPPGNPANAHTICVGNDAVPAHLDHGDFVGTCSCTPDGGIIVDDDAGTPTSDGGNTTPDDGGTTGGDDGGIVL